MMIIDKMLAELFENGPTLNEEWFTRLGSAVVYIVTHPSGGTDVPLAFVRFDIAKLQMGTTLSLSQRLQGNLDLVIALTVNPQEVSSTSLNELAGRENLTDQDYAHLAWYAATAFAKDDARLLRWVSNVLASNSVWSEPANYDRLTGQLDIVRALAKQLAAQAQHRALIAAIDREQRALIQAVVSSQNLGPSTSELATALSWSPERTTCVAKHLVAVGVLHRFVNRVSPGDARWRLTASEQRVLQIIA